MSDEKEDWEALLKHPGWLRLVERARRDWREGYPEKIKLAIASAKANHDDISSAVAAVDAAADAVNVLISWPSERVRQLGILSHVEAQSLSRGGYDPTPAR